MTKQKLLIGALCIVAMAIGGAIWLPATPAPAPVAVPVATPTVGTPTAAPSTIMVDTPTTVTVTAQITDPTLVSGGVNLLRLSSSGSSTVLGMMHDDGLNGDSMADDTIYTLQFLVKESVQGAFALQVSAAFKGQLRRVMSPVTQFAVINPQGVSAVDDAAVGSTIVLGIVSNQTALLDAGKIATDLTISVSRVLKGSNIPAVIQVRTSGGILGGAHSFAAGDPFFITGENVVLLLTGPNLSGLFALTAGALGTYHIRVDPTLGQIAVIDSAYSGLDALQAGTPQYESFLQRSAAGQVTLSELYTEFGLAQ